MIKKFQKRSYRWSAIGFVTIAAISALTLLNAHAEETQKVTKEQKIGKSGTYNINKYPTDDLIINYANGEVFAANGQYQFEIQERTPEKINGDPNIVITREYQKFIEEGKKKEGAIVVGETVVHYKKISNN